MIPVLMYHRVGPVPAGAWVKSHYISPRLLRNHLRLMRFLGYESQTVASIAQHWPENKSFAITFDDAYASVATLASPILEDLQMKATVYVVTGHIGGTNAWDEAHGEVTEALMTEDQLRSWQKAGHEIGSHSQTHPRLATLSAEAVSLEAYASLAVIRDRFQVSAPTFCYPYGSENEAVREAIRDAGYLAACATTKGAWTPATDRYQIPRINCRKDTWTPLLFLKIMRSMRSSPRGS